MADILYIESKFYSSFKAVDYEVEKVVLEMQKRGIILNKKLHLYLQFAFRELFNNAVEHGNHMDETKKIIYRVWVDETHVEIEVEDCGDGFDLALMSNAHLNDEVLRHRKRGLISMLHMGFFLRRDANRVYATLPLIDERERREKRGNKMNITIEDDVAYCSSLPNISGANVDDMATFMRRRLNNGHHVSEVVMDMTNSEIIDSIGISFLIHMFKELEDKGMTMRFKGTSEELLGLFQIMRLDEVFKFEK